MESERAAKDIKLLSKLMNADASAETGICKDERDALYQVLAGKFRHALGNTTMPRQEELYDEIMDIIDGMDFLRKYPQLIGKTIIGIVGMDKERANSGLKEIVGEEAADQATKFNVNLPLIFLHGDDSITVTNDVGNLVVLDKDEYRRTNISLYHNYQPKIDIKQFLQSFSLSTMESFSHIALVYFPRLFASNMPFSRMLMEKLDAVIIYAHDPITKDSPAGRRLQQFKELGNHNAIPLYIATDMPDKMRENVADVEVLSENGVYPVLEALNQPCDNGAFAVNIENCLLRARSFCEKQKQELKNIQNSIATDLTRLGNKENETKNAIREIKDDIQKRAQQAGEEWEKLRDAMLLLMDKANEYEKALSRAGDLRTGMVRPTASAMKAWGEIILQSLDMGDNHRAVEYRRKLEEAGHRWAYVYQLLASDEEKTSTALRQLREESNTSDFICSAKIRLRDALELNERDCKMIASEMRKPKTADEWYFRAKWEEDNGNIKTAVADYIKALDVDAKAVGSKIFSLVKGEGQTKIFISMEKLATYMIPEANYELGVQKRKFSDGNKFLTIAAAQGYIPAVKILTDDLYKELMNGVCSSTEDRNEKIDACLFLYQRIAEHEDDAASIYERIGDLWKQRGDYYRALEQWEKAATGAAYYKCGRRYKDGDGVHKDLGKARAYFNKAIQCGYSDAKGKLAEVEQELKKRKAHKRKQQIIRKNLGTEYREKISEGKEKTGLGICTIVTATCVALDSPCSRRDNRLFQCLHFWISKQIDGESLINAYHEIAPRIVTVIDSLPKAKDIYCDIWHKYLKPCLSYLESKKYEQGKAIYVNMVFELQRKYLVE